MNKEQACVLAGMVGFVIGTIFAALLSLHSPNTALHRANKAIAECQEVIPRNQKCEVQFIAIPVEVSE